jgi:uncharacterized protein YeaO (DUF488 family)
MPVSIVRLGSPRLPGEGLRLGTVRRPPRGILKADYASKDYFDVWLPSLAPTPDLVKLASSGTAQHWRRFVTRYRREMTRTDARALIEVLAALSHATNFSVGCYCADESRCHRSILRQLLAERNAELG